MQLRLDLPVQPAAGTYAFGTRSDGGTHGVVLTKGHLVDLILDLAGYRAESRLTDLRFLEPACGTGAFLLPAVRRLMAAAQRDGVPAESLGGAITTFDVDPEHVRVTRSAVDVLLKGLHIPAAVRRTMLAQWIRHDDFLLAPTAQAYDVIVGNPPYVRIEQLPAELQAEYRRLFVTLFDRADLYVAFIERSLRLLADGGALSFVCADRWTLNRYGAPLRELLASAYNVRAYIDLHDASPFESEVIAYPSIFLIGKERQTTPVPVVTMSTAAADECPAVRSAILGLPAGEAHPHVTVARYDTWFSGKDPWTLSSPAHVATLRTLEARHPALQADGMALVRIGVATGHDAVFVVPADADIEADRLVPLVMREDLVGGGVRDGQRCVINTSDDRGVIDLSLYPRLAAYFAKHEHVIRKRHVARTGGSGWFKTIDRVYPEFVTRPKLLIPDIAGSNEVVFESGGYYPHHNLYYVLSDAWDMEVLGGLLSSRVALFFVWSYAVKMRGGYLRFQAQYLRRIRVPSPKTLAPNLAREIKAAFRARDFAALDTLAMEAYGLTELPDFDFVDTRS